MLEWFDHFCTENDLRYYAIGGTMLGAIRHHGFIPWDDDIDMLFTPPEYEKFLEVWDKFADKERYSLCLQTKDYNDHTLSGSVRDNNTTFITDSTVDFDVNQGLAIDIGKLTVCPKSKFGQKMQVVWGAGLALFLAGRVPARQSTLVKNTAKIILGIFRSERARYCLPSWYIVMTRIMTKRNIYGKYPCFHS